MALGDDGGSRHNDRSPLNDEGWQPVKVDRVLKDGDTVTLGGTTLRAVWAPGHTPGCTVWTTRVQDAGKPYSVAFYACGGPNAGVRLVGNSRFPHLVEETLGSFGRLKQLKPDIYLTMHPQSLFAGKVERIRARELPHPLYDPDGWTKMIADAEANFLKRVKEEQTTTAASAQTDTSRGAIFAALQRGADSEVERLLAGDESRRRRRGGTPALMAATLFGNTETVALL
jgi:metallo-beta-lactamase class B